MNIKRYLYYFLILFSLTILKSQIFDMNSYDYMLEIWSTVDHRICKEYKDVFTRKDPEGWLSFFSPKSNINVYQYTKGDNSSKQKVKNYKLFNGKLFTSMLRGRMPAKVMASVTFKKLEKQSYSYSEMQLSGINIVDSNNLAAKIKFQRFNQSDLEYERSIAIYNLEKIDNNWYIKEMHIYEENKENLSLLDSDDFWHPSLFK